MGKNLKFYLKSILNEDELNIMPTSFDVIGSIMIFAEFPKKLSKKEKIIGNEILKNYHNIKTILKKTKKFSGKFRTPKYKIIAGIKTKEAAYKENNVALKLDVEKVYFSPRLSGERMRIAKLIKKNERILVMFSGSAIYPLVIARNSNPKIVYGIEINPTAHRYALENIKINKMEDKIKLIKGDVKNINKKNFPLRKFFLERFDRILMPLPKGGEIFLDIALKSAKKNAVIHFYDFLNENEFNEAEKKIETSCKKQKRKFEILNFVKCGEFGPKIYRVCVDFRVG